MIKGGLLTFKLVLLTFVLQAQSSSTVFDLYLDFNEYYLNNQPKAVEVAQQILNSAEKLSEKQKTNFYYKLASIHEKMNNSEMAIKFFSKVVEAEPEFYVPHRALGYFFVVEANTFINKMNASRGNKAEHAKYFNEYRLIIKKALPHLEKATACDPNEETLNLIKKLYQQIKEPGGVNTLDGRLKKMGENCITVLTDF